MDKTDINRLLLTFMGLLLLSGCASKAPSIAHTHVGHTLSGWVDTPNQEGLLKTAEKSADEALRAAQSAVSGGKDLAAIKADVARLVLATDPSDEFAEGQPGKVVYGVKNALAGGVAHITYAAESPDASANLKEGAALFASHANVVLERCTLIKALGTDIAHSSSQEEAELLSQELLNMARANVSGNDANNDGVVGSVPDEYGLKQLRAELQSVLDRENPAYTTVDSWYLFNLIRLPSGDWIFKQRDSAGAGSGSAGY